ncbi:4-(cytidine 5'-diphospho)-2-C-methyl-D-erythritol kinase [Frigidibacter sp. SLM-1]|nr:4-(cytidine 5'-diphospho)-2-C-methyl-D-erythritol kinase [Frigidibacter sp. ROC022]MCR8724916.1 4-(cytidine 5'-diphospho)-2-C-methyl-D-erythritol kinase [Frigidibacter sp. ROC022]
MPRKAEAPVGGPVRETAPAKINLALHVTGRRADGYHLLDSLVAFADDGDRLTVELGPASVLHVAGPEAQGVPTDDANSILRAAALMGAQVVVHLDKQLPSAAGIGGGSSDAAAALRAIRKLTGTALPDRPERLGADVPVCLTPSAARMQGIGEVVTRVALAPLPAVLVNPRRAVATPAVFAALARADMPPMPDPLPPLLTAEDAILFLAAQRNDLEPAAIGLEPAIDAVLAALSRQPEVRLARMSGSGATCFGLCETPEAAHRTALALAGLHPGWWVKETVLR